MKDVLLLAALLLAQGNRRPEPGPAAGLSLILGRPTDRSVAVSLLSDRPLEAQLSWSRPQEAQVPAARPLRLEPGVPQEVELEGLVPGATYTCRLATRAPGQGAYAPAVSGTFTTGRAPGATFTFTAQGDSHPERPGRMFDPTLYTRTLTQVAKDRPDFHVLLGDDFSIERLIERQALSQPAVDAVYLHQRGFLGQVGAPLFLVNGNHEQAARYLLDGSDTNAAVLAARARNHCFPLPAPGRFYTGDTEAVAPIGLLRDYVAWTWGDALFVLLDPYWHSPVPVDNRGGQGPKEGRPKRDLWEVTLGDAQYRWLEKTLRESRARWKFVFAHHVNGTGRGGVEEAGFFEWGGRDRRGDDRFRERRPGWERPIHALFVKTGVTAFFQGHDHLYAQQERDGVIYQTVPCPADPTGTAFNREAYRSGEVLPNSGHLRVTVSPKDVKVAYIRSLLPADETPDRIHGAVAHTYTIRTERP